MLKISANKCNLKLLWRWSKSSRSMLGRNAMDYELLPSKRSLTRFMSRAVGGNDVKRFSFISARNLIACEWHPCLVRRGSGGTRGQLASDAFEDSLEPLLLSTFAKGNVDASTATPTCPPILDMACGGAHAAAVLLNEGEEHGQVVTWGNGDSGALGHGKESDVSVPKVLEFFNNISVCSVAAGWSHTAYLKSSENSELVGYISTSVTEIA